MIVAIKIIRSNNNHWLLLLLILLANAAFCQTNLVPNYSFENYITCPEDHDNPLPPPWYLTTNKIYPNGFYLS